MNDRIVANEAVSARICSNWCVENAFLRFVNLHEHRGCIRVIAQSNLSSFSDFSLLPGDSSWFLSRQDRLDGKFFPLGAT
jgi:hypothetical protein